MEIFIDQLNSNLNEIKFELEKLKINLENVKIFIYDYVPMRLQEIFSQLNGKYGLNVVEAMVLEGKLIVICRRSGESLKTMLGLTVIHDNHTNRES